MVSCGVWFLNSSLAPRVGKSQQQSTKEKRDHQRNFSQETTEPYDAALNRQHQVYEGHRVWILKFQPQAGPATIRIIGLKSQLRRTDGGFSVRGAEEEKLQRRQRWDSAETSGYFEFQLKREPTVDRLFHQIKARQLTSSWREGAFGIKRRISARLLHLPQFGRFQWGRVSRWTAGGSSGRSNFISNFYQTAEYKLNLFFSVFFSGHTSVGALLLVSFLKYIFNVQCFCLLDKCSKKY